MTRKDGDMAGPVLILVRHGETQANVEHRLDTVPPGEPLTATGWTQAKDTGEQLAGRPVAAVYSSTALRAQQTATALAAPHAVPVRVLDGVHEIFCGDFENSSDPKERELFEEIFASWADGDLSRPLPGGESAADLLDRFLPVLDALWREHADRPKQPIVLVSHGAAIRIVAQALLGEPVATRYMPNAGRAELVPAEGAPWPGSWRLEFWTEGEPPPGDPTGGSDDRPAR
jgi:probable phosphoglycerate mutase